MILDLATKCGIAGGTKTNINVNYKITVSSSSFEFREVIKAVLQLGIRILLVTISPVISNEFNFPCPLQASDISVRLPSAVPLLQLLIMLDRNSLMGVNLNDSWLSPSGSLVLARLWTLSWTRAQWNHWFTYLTQCSFAACIYYRSYKQ